MNLWLTLILAMADSNSSLIIDVLTRLPTSSRPWWEEKFLVTETSHDPGYICLPATTNEQGSLQWVLAVWKKSGLMFRRAIWKQLTDRCSLSWASGRG